MSIHNYTSEKSTDTTLIHKLGELKNQHGENNSFSSPTLSFFYPHSTHKIIS